MDKSTFETLKLKYLLAWFCCSLKTSDSGTVCASGRKCDGLLICFLGHVAHLCLDVAQQEESDRGDAADHLCDPEGRVPAVVLGDGAERKPRQETTNCRESKSRTFRGQDEERRRPAAFNISYSPAGFTFVFDDVGQK